MVTASKFVVARTSGGGIRESDLLAEEEELPELEDGEFLVEALYLSVDPCMGLWADSYKIGQTMIGTQVATVTESKNEDYPAGTTVVGNFGWRTHTIVDRNSDFYYLPNIGSLPKSLGLGVLGFTGCTAYFGLLDICKPQPGETVLVTAAGGAVGSHVGQIAKILGCTVIGITGSDEKIDWLKSIGFDGVINYKTTTDINKALKQAAPNGIDCYFDNVGGEVSSQVIIHHMNKLGRIAVCGAISSYESAELPKASIYQDIFWQKHLKMKGFSTALQKDRYSQAIQRNLRWVQEGKLQYRETVTTGFENTAKALIAVLRGENIGKAVVKIRANERQSVNFHKLMRSFEK